MTTVTALAPLWPHQDEALSFIEERDAALLAVQMGGGKSRIVVEECSRSRYSLVLILCPLSVVSVWPGQFRQHSADPFHFRVVTLDHGSVAAKRDEAIGEIARAKINGQRVAIVVNYEAAWREPLAAWILKQDWDLVVCDESHRIKAPGGKASRFCSRLGDRVSRRLALTGTPMAHSPLDIYAQYRFLDKRVFGTSFTAFRARYAVMGGYQNHQVTGYQNRDELQRKFASIAFQADALKRDEPVHMTRECELGPEGKRIYKALEKDLIAEVDAGQITAANAMVKLLRLQQVTGGSVRDDDGNQRVVDESKRKLLADVLEDLAPREPVVIFARFRSDLDAIRHAALWTGHRYGELSGRKNELADWQAGETDVLGTQIQAGSVGIDLTRAHYAIYYSVGFSLADYQQSLARLDRPGQTQPVTYIHLNAAGTVNRRVYQALANRQEVVESILNGLHEEAA